MDNSLSDPGKKAMLERFREPGFVLLLANLILFAEWSVNLLGKTSLLDMNKSPTELPVGSFLVLLVLFAGARYTVARTLLRWMRSIDNNAGISKGVEQWFKSKEQKEEEADIKKMLAKSDDIVLLENLKTDAMEEKNSIAMQAVKELEDWRTSRYAEKEECFLAGVLLLAIYWTTNYSFINALAHNYGFPTEVASTVACLLTHLAALTLIAKGVPYLDPDEVRGFYLPGNTINKRNRERRAQALGRNRGKEADLMLPRAKPYLRAESTPADGESQKLHRPEMPSHRGLEDI